MANNCYNFINTESEELKEWFNKYLVEKYSELEFLTDLPVYTEEEKEAKKVYEVVGTKWIDVQDIEEDYIRFDSAWGPPTELLRRLSEKFQIDFDLEYSEIGCEIFGSISFSNGEITLETTYPNEFVFVTETSDFGDALEFLANDELDPEMQETFINDVETYYEDSNKLEGIIEQIKRVFDEGKHELED